MRLRRDGVSARELDGELVMLDLRGNRYLTVSASGTLLLQRLEEGAGRDELVAALTERYGIDAATAGADVDAFLGQLRAEHLLE